MASDQSQPVQLCKPELTTFNLHLAQVTAVEALISQKQFILTFAGKLMPHHGRGLL